MDFVKRERERERDPIAIAITITVAIAISIPFSWCLTSLCRLTRSKQGGSATFCLLSPLSGDLLLSSKQGVVTAEAVFHHASHCTSHIAHRTSHIAVLGSLEGCEWGPEDCSASAPWLPLLPHSPLPAAGAAAAAAPPLVFCLPNGRGMK